MACGRVYAGVPKVKRIGVACRVRRHKQGYPSTPPRNLVPQVSRRAARHAARPWSRAGRSVHASCSPLCVCTSSADCPCLTMDVTGLGPAEYCRLEATDLHPLTFALTVRGTKLGRQGAQLVRVPKEAWAWVEQAVPASISQDGLSALLEGGRSRSGARGPPPTTICAMPTPSG